MKIMRIVSSPPTPPTIMIVVDPCSVQKREHNANMPDADADGRFVAVAFFSGRIEKLMPMSITYHRR